ncbi:hypothetical protein P8V03_15680 [Clostridium sp. A1-XYC3]|uniref:DUF2140 family protein n=1 Tax=Clostridium tanneri TaxID=3037988 RepID=A0ABU4JWQ0_9CLOT|nr:hypothetical protein [Clostridium sp. A1-XYC3]MDW8802588.1 hypothetical protein [Clostridium sp. A1-XYC3]
MNKIINCKKFKLCVGIIVLAALLITFFKLLFWNSSYTMEKTKVSASFVDKVTKSQKQGETLKLDKEELNQAISMYIKEEKSSGNIRIKGIQGDIVNGNLKLYVPTSYKGINLLITSEGKLSYEENKVVYTPLYFKAGKITLPKDFVMAKLKDKSKDKISIENGTIAVKEEILPIKINSIEVKNDEIFVGMKKVSNIIEEKIKDIQNNIKDALKNNNLTEDNASKSNLENNTSSGETKGNDAPSENTKNLSQRDEALDRINNGLSAAGGSVSTGGQKAVISSMISAINSMKGNPSANPYSAAGGVRAVYNKLSQQEKTELKAAVFSNINGTDINIVSSMIGK